MLIPTFSWSFFLKIEMFDLHAISIFCHKHWWIKHHLTTPFFCKLWNTIYREIISIMMKTIKKTFESLYKIYLDGLGSCLFLEFTFVFFTSDIQSPQHLGLEMQIIHSDYLCRTNSQYILIIDNQKVCMYYQVITSLFRGFFSLRKILSRD
jgi:hypothetical protein